jgi:membrane protein involved in D-alanine export
VFALVSILAFWILKGVSASTKIYRFAIFSMSLVYLVLLFPKPMQFIGLVVYSYFIHWLFAVRFKYPKLLLPIILLSIPMIFMKLAGIFPAKTNENFVQFVFQVAGLSYVTFRVIQIYIDERSSAKQPNWVDYFNFTAFTPTLLIGPIDRFQRFTKNVSIGFQQLNTNSFSKAWNYLMLGLLYKFIFAEIIHVFFLSKLVDDGQFLFHFQYMYVYLFYLFFDFAGYSLLAMSYGYFIGIEVPYNFDKPFLSENPKVFWTRWHKSLGDWLNDFFFKPIFKDLTTRQVFKPIQRQNVALLLTFSLMGFWNGFELHYIISGMLFGLLSVIHNYYVYLCKKNKKDVFFGNLNPKYIRLISIFMLFNYVAFAIYIFSGKLF